ncbi:hypothetical protein J6V85_00355 [Candidatus Saccharibacteria bacterium]|nr:hypothetical protein [Candidatus Saccharibacteria bacterium]
MKKILIILALFLVSGLFIPYNVMAISEEQENLVSVNCSTIKSKLKKVQQLDAKVRVYLGSYYEAIATKFIIPMNVRLVENNLSTAEMVENQNKFAEARTVFSNDFEKYQQVLEELINMNCTAEPEKFYEQLVIVRQKRKIMTQDVLQIRTLLSGHVKLVREVMTKL